jgi:hypothetical protein
MNVSADLLKQALELMKDAELQGRPGSEKLKFVQECLRTFVRSQEAWSLETKTQALNFINDVLPGAIELAVKFSKLKFVETAVASIWCC